MTRRLALSPIRDLGAAAAPRLPRTRGLALLPIAPFLATTAERDVTSSSLFGSETRAVRIQTAR